MSRRPLPLIPGHNQSKKQEDQYFLHTDPRTGNWEDSTCFGRHDEMFICLGVIAKQGAGALEPSYYKSGLGNHKTLLLTGCVDGSVRPMFEGEKLGNETTA